MIIQLLSGGLLGAFIGYFTNFIALRMLFFPKRRVFGFQGLLLKFKAKFAGKTADFIFQFINLDDILKDLVDKKAFSEGIKETSWTRLTKFIGNIVTTEMERWLSDEDIRKSVSESLTMLTPKMKEMLSEKIINTDIDILTSLILHGTPREIRFIQGLGGILGIVIGMLHSLILQKLPYIQLR